MGLGFNIFYSTQLRYSRILAFVYSLSTRANLHQWLDSANSTAAPFRFACQYTGWNVGSRLPDGRQSIGTSPWNSPPAGQIMLSEFYLNVMDTTVF